MNFSNTQVYDTLYTAMMDAGYDSEVANAVATHGLHGLAVLDRRAQDQCHDAYIARVIEASRLAILHAY